MHARKNAPLQGNLKTMSLEENFLVGLLSMFMYRKNTESSVVMTHGRKQKSSVVKMPRETREKKEKELRTAYCASASLQRREEIPVASDGRSEKGAAPGREEENGRGEGHENATKYKGKESKNSAVLHTLWTKEAMVLRRASVFCCIVRLAKQREGLGVQSLADLSNLHLSGCRAFVFDGLKRFQDCPQSRTVVRGRNQGR